MNTTLRNEDNLPRYGSSRQPSTQPNINYIIGDEIQEIPESTTPYLSSLQHDWYNPDPPTPYSQEEEDHIEYERRLADTTLQETEKIRNTPF